MKRVMFVCKFNRFRSQLATGFFNKLADKKKYQAVSAGIIRGYPISSEVKKLARKHKIKIDYPKGLAGEVLNSQDIIIIVADDVPPEIFKNNKAAGTKILVWKIKDTKETPGKQLDSTVKQIQDKVEKFVRSLS